MAGTHDAMTEVSGSGEQRAPQEFERVLAAAATAQASFDDETLSLIERGCSTFSIAYPTVVPFIVLLLGVLLGSSSRRALRDGRSTCRRSCSR